MVHPWHFLTTVFYCTNWPIQYTDKIILIYMYSYNTDLSHGFLSDWWWSITMTTLSSSDECSPAKTLWSTRVRDSLPLRWRSWRSRSSLKVRWSGFMPVWLRRYLESVLRWNCDFGVFSTGRHLVWLEDEVWKREKSWMSWSNVMRSRTFSDLLVSCSFKLHNHE